MRYYRLIGKLPYPCRDALEWADWFLTADRQVAKTAVGPLSVSTVFLGFDHNLNLRGDPILFETMIFGDGDVGEECYQDRYHSWEEAVAGHARAVAHAEQIVAKANLLLIN